NQTRTYELSLTIMFLDRLGDPFDRPIIQLLGIRLVAGQCKNGGWTYDCGNKLTPQDRARIQATLLKEAQQAANQPPAILNAKIHPTVARWAKTLTPLTAPEAVNWHDGDNSNTQFATLALWIARKHGVACDKAIAALDKRYRTSQEADGGW